MATHTVPSVEASSRRVRRVHHPAEYRRIDSVPAPGRSTPLEPTKAKERKFSSNSPESPSRQELPCYLFQLYHIGAFCQCRHCGGAQKRARLPRRGQADWTPVPPRFQSGATRHGAEGRPPAPMLWRAGRKLSPFLTPQGLTKTL